MRGGSTREVLRHLRTLYQCGVTGHLSDEQLLELFLARRDETAEEAFATIVQRHGPMVLGVCVRVLGNAHEAEDAFQATFLVLARKAASVIRREKVANWLYGVACRTAKEARGRAARRRAREERVSMSPCIEPADDSLPDELRRIIDEELAKLPARYRAPVVLCELEGLSRQDAARQLGIPEGTLSSRLARAKSQLRDRLARRGLTEPIVVLTAALGREAGAAALSDLLIESTASAAMRVAVGSSTSAVVSASVASLTEGVLKAMLLAKLKGIVLGTGTMALVVSGAVALAQPGGGFGPPPSPSQADRAAAMEKKLDRILDALDRLSRIAPPGPQHNTKPATQAINGPVARSDTTTPISSEAAQVFVSDAILAAQKQPPSPRIGRPALDGTHRLPLADRMEVVEQELQRALTGLEQIERRLTELESRVGGAGTHNAVNPRSQDPRHPQSQDSRNQSPQPGTVAPENSKDPEKPGQKQASPFD